MLVGLVLGTILAAALLAAQVPQQLWVQWRQTQPEAYLDSPHYAQVIEQFGVPERWWLADGAREPEASDTRIEQWFYPDQGVWIWFIDGQRGTEQYFTPEQALLEVSSPISPLTLHRGMTQAQVEQQLGVQGQMLEPVTTEIGTSQTWAYPEVSLLVQYLDGQFLTAQTM